MLPPQGRYPPNPTYTSRAYLSTSMLYQKMARAFVRKGHQVHVICQSAERPVDRTDEGVQVHEVGANPNQPRVTRRISYSYRAWRKLRELISRHGIDVVNAEFFLADGFPYALTKGEVPLVLQTHAWADGWIETNTRLGRCERQFFSSAEKYTAHRADRIIATSKSTEQWLVEKAGLRRNRVTIIHEFTDTGQYRPVQSNFRARVGIPEDCPMILFVGKLTPRKGPIVLARSIPFILKKNPETRFVIIGNDTDTSPHRTSMKAYIESLADVRGATNKIIFTGMISQSDVIEAYSACDVFVYPGLLEAGGVALLEAMACNCPIVATSTGTAAELIDVSTVFRVVTPGNEQELAAAILQLLHLPRDELKRHAGDHRKIVEEQFPIDRMATKILNAYEEVIS